MLWKKYPDDFLRQEDWFRLISRPQKGAAKAEPFCVISAAMPENQTANYETKLFKDWHG
jgi:hypothetical protein